MAKTIATIKGTMLAPGVSKNNRMYTPSAIGRMVSRMKERLSDPSALPVVMRTHHDAGDNSRLIVGRITNVEQQPDGRATYEAKLYNTVAGRDIAALIDSDTPALRTTSVYGYWVGPTSEAKQDGKRVEVGEDLAIDALDFTASPGVEQSRIDSVAFESHSMTLASIGESALDGKTVCETYEATVELDLAPDEDLEVWERNFSAKQRKSMASAGQAMPDGRYPIANKSDLRNAIKAVGRGSGDHNAIRKHIMKRAAALGLSSMIPKGWGADGSVAEAIDLKVETDGRKLFDSLVAIAARNRIRNNPETIRLEIPSRSAVRENQVAVCINDDDGCEIVRICAINVDYDTIKKAAKQAAKIACRVIDPDDDDGMDDMPDNMSADVPADDSPDPAAANDGFSVQVGSDPVDDANDYESVRNADMSVLEVKVDGSGGLDELIQALIAVQGKKPSDVKSEPAATQETKEQESAVSETEKPAAAAAPVASGLSEADLAKLAALIGTSLKEALAEAAASKAQNKAKKSKPADTNNDGPAESAAAIPAEALKESTITAADLEKRLKEERDKTVADLRETFIKENGLPQRKGYRVSESDTDVTPTGDELWDKRGDVWAQFFPWGQTQQAAAPANTAA